MKTLTTRRRNALSLAKKLATEFDKIYQKDGKRRDVIYEELSHRYFLSPDTIRNKVIDWKNQPEEVKQLIE